MNALDVIDELLQEACRTAESAGETKLVDKIVDVQFEVLVRQMEEAEKAFKKR